MFVEEPVLPGDVDAMKEISRRYIDTTIISPLIQTNCILAHPFQLQQVKDSSQDGRSKSACFHFVSVSVCMHVCSF